MSVFRKIAVRSQVRKRADLAARSDVARCSDGIWLYVNPGIDDDIGQHAALIDDAAFANPRLAAKLHAAKNFDVAPKLRRHRCWSSVDHAASPREHVPTIDPRPHVAFRDGQIGPVIYAHHFLRRRDNHRHFFALRDQQLDERRQIKLARHRAFVHLAQRSSKNLASTA